MNAEKWMFHSHNQHFELENEAHRKIDDYPHTKHPNDQLKLFIFFTKLENDNRVPLNITVNFTRIVILISIFN